MATPTLCSQASAVNGLFVPCVQQSAGRESMPVDKSPKIGRMDTVKRDTFYRETKHHTTVKRNMFYRATKHLLVEIYREMKHLFRG